MIELGTPLDRIVSASRGKGKSKNVAALTGLSTLGLVTVGDVLRHFPRRYDTWGELSDLGALRIGAEVTICARVATTKVVTMRDRKEEMLLVTVTDGRSNLALTFFNAKGLKHVVTPGSRGIFSGTVSMYRHTRQLTHPKCQIVDAGLDEEETAALIDKPMPIYRANSGVDSTSIRRIVELVLATVDDPPDPLPEGVRERHRLMGAHAAYRAIHLPRTEAEWQVARHRFGFEEAFVLQTVMAQRRNRIVAEPAIARRSGPGGLLEAFDARLPFRLTQGQMLVGEEIRDDLAASHPMHRLLQGEVGAGKTLVALRAMLTVVEAGGQAALLAPTEVLAWQHYRTITAMLGDLVMDGPNPRVRLLTGSLSAPARKEALLDIACGDAGVVIGTHALLSKTVSFFELGLVVVDEQHRFGVEQRKMLQEKGRTALVAATPHLLVMTATPIPRTVAMSVFGDLDVSTLAELPAGRSPITTHVVSLIEAPAWYERIWVRVAEEVAAGRQVYVVCPRIDDQGPGTGPGGNDSDSEAAAMRSVVEVLAEVRAHPRLAGLRVEAMHGQVAADERDRIMGGFAAGTIDVLVATTIIEVGVDVARASMMVVMDAERFGVSQLHQLRGRVGRGAAPGLCLLVTGADDGPSRARLDAVAATNDGFELARVDLEQRREGDILGTAQSGRISSLRMLSVVQDEKLIDLARAEAVALVAADPELLCHPVLAAAIEDLVGDNQDYLESS